MPHLGINRHQQALTQHIFNEFCTSQQTVLATIGRYDLQAHWQAGLGHAAWNRDRRARTERCHRHNQQPIHIGVKVSPITRTYVPFLNRKRRNNGGRAQQKIILRQKLMHAPEQGTALRFR